jgi:hypothetical protein
VIGAFAGGSFTPALVLLFLTALMAFLSRQPMTLAVKVLSGRRRREDLPPALFWTAVYALLSLAGVVALAMRGQHRLLLLAAPGLPVFLWYLWLVSRRKERGQRAVELAGSGVLALTAPAAYWTASGTDRLEPWILWSLTWLQTAASIVLVYLRLAQRQMEGPLRLAERLRMGRRTLAYHGFNLLYSVALAAWRLAPVGVPLAFLLTLGDALEGVIHPPLGAKPTRIGLRQLAASTSFVLVMVGAYLL